MCCCCFSSWRLYPARRSVLPYTCLLTGIDYCSAPIPFSTKERLKPHKGKLYAENKSGSEGGEKGKGRRGEGGGGKVYSTHCIGFSVPVWYEIYDHSMLSVTGAVSFCAHKGVRILQAGSFMFHLSMRHVVKLPLAFNVLLRVRPTTFKGGLVLGITKKKYSE